MNGLRKAGSLHYNLLNLDREGALANSTGSGQEQNSPMIGSWPLRLPLSRQAENHAGRAGGQPAVGG
jgi:hypothetical protein